MRPKTSLQFSHQSQHRETFGGKFLLSFVKYIFKILNDLANRLLIFLIKKVTKTFLGALAPLQMKFTDFCHF